MKTKMSKRLLAVLMTLALTLSVATPGFAAYEYENSSNEPGYTTDYEPPYGGGYSDGSEPPEGDYGYGNDNSYGDNGYDNNYGESDYDEDGEDKDDKTNSDAPDYPIEDDELLPAALPILVEIAPYSLVTIPDANFVTALQTHSPPLPSSLIVSGQLDTTVAATVSHLNLQDRNISDLSGIDYFTNLQHLYVNNNNLTTIDVSANTLLTHLWAFGNNLTDINVSANTLLTQLYVYNNNLNAIDVSANTALTHLSVRDNSLNSLNISANTLLTHLWAYGNNLTDINVSANTLLTQLYVYNNSLTTIDVSANTALTHLSVRHNSLNSLNISANTALMYLYVNNNNLETIDVSANTALVYLIAYNNSLTTIDVSTNTALMYLYVHGNNLNNIDVSANTALTRLYVYDNNLTTLDVSANTALTHLSVRYNNLISLDVSSNTALVQLNVQNNYMPGAASVIGNTLVGSGFIFTPQRSITPPTINGITEIPLPAGYTETYQSAPFTITHNAPLFPPIVTIDTPQDYGGRITWNAVNNTLNIAPGLSSRFYTVILSADNSRANGGEVTSHTIVIEVLDPIVDAQTPTITQQPQGGAVIPNGNIALSVEANVTDGGTLTYQWYSRAHGQSATTLIPGATNPTFNPPTSSVGEIEYFVIVTNTNTSVNGNQTAQSTSTVARVTVNTIVHAQTPAIIQQPLGVTTIRDGTINLTVEARVTDGGTLTYQWFSNPTNSNTGGTLIPGATNPSFTPPTNATGVMYYYAVVTNTNTAVNGNQTAEAVSAAVAVVVNDLTNAQVPNITAQPQGVTVQQTVNATLTVEANVTDGGTLTYQWYSNTIDGYAGSTAILGATSPSFNPPTNATGVIYYYVVITNTNLAVTGNTIASASSIPAMVVTTTAPPTPPTITGVTISPVTVTVNRGNTQQFIATVQGTNNPSQAVTWTVTNNNSASTTISASGLLTVASNETASNLTVRTTSTANTAHSATASVTVTSGGGSGGNGSGGGGSNGGGSGGGGSGGNQGGGNNQGGSNVNHTQTTGETEDCPIPRVWVVPSETLTAEWQELLGDYTEYLEIVIETSDANRLGGYVTAAISFTIDNEELNRLLTAEMPRILQEPNAYFTIFADLLCVVCVNLNYYRITAFQGDRLLGGGIKSSEDMIFSVRAYSPGTFTIAYVENLRRLVVPLDSYVIVDLAENAPNKIMDVLPMLQNDRTLIPIRFIAEALGAAVDWTNATAYRPLTVHITVDGQTLSFGIGETSPQLVALGMDVPAQLMGERTMVPLRFVSEFFGAVVEWDGNTRRIEIINIGSVLNTNQNANPNANQTNRASDLLAVFGRDDEDEVR